MAILVGSLASAIVLGPILLALNDASTVYVPRITCEPVAGAPAPLPAATAAALPAYTAPASASMPAGARFRLLHYAAGKGAPIAGLDPGDYLIDRSGRIAYRVRQNFPAELRADPRRLGRAEKLTGPQAAADGATYRVWQKTDAVSGPPGRYFATGAGVPVYLVDPGINGTHPFRPNGSRVPKYDAPKATLVSYIIKGILNRQLPWGLVLLGVMISVVLEMCGIPSLAFAVGVYLPLSSSSPIFIGGMVRWGVDLYLRRKLAHRKPSEEELTAEGDRGPGVLLASGYIAGGAIAGVVIAFMAGVLTSFNDRLTEVMKNNPFFGGPRADLYALLPFCVLVAVLYLTGRERLLAGSARS